MWEGVGLILSGLKKQWLLHFGSNVLNSILILCLVPHSEVHFSIPGTPAKIPLFIYNLHRLLQSTATCSHFCISGEHSTKHARLPDLLAYNPGVLWIVLTVRVLGELELPIYKADGIKII